MLVKLLIEGGNMTPGPAVAQQLGPMGINLGKVVSDVNAATKDFKGITVPVHLDVDSKTKTYTIKVLSPPTSELIKKELKIDKGSGDRLKLNVGNMAIEQIISVTKTKQSGLLAKDFPAAVRSVIGSALALGVLIESKDPKEILAEMKDGAYAKEIASQKTDVSPQKRKELDEHFKKVQKLQEAEIKKAEEEKAAKEEKKEGAAAAPGADAAKAAEPAKAAKAADSKKK